MPDAAASAPAVPESPLLSGLARNAGAQFAARLVGVAIQGLGLILVARELGPGEYGGFALVSTLTVMATVVADWGLVMVGARAAAAERERAPEILRACLTLRLGLGVVAGAVLIVLAFAGSDRGVVHAAALVAATSFVPGAWFTAANIQAQLDLRMERVALGTIAGSLASLTWIVVVLTLDGGIVWLAGTFVANTVVTTLATLVLSRGRLPLRPGGERDELRRLLAQSHPVGIGYLLVTIYFYIDAVLLARLSSLEQLGLYDAAYRFVQVGLMVPGVLVTSIYTVAADLAVRDRARMAEFVRELLSVVAVFVPVPLVVLATAPGDLMELVYGNAFRDGALLLAILAAAVALVFLSGVVGPMLVTLGRERATMRIAVAATVVNLSSNAVLIPLLDARGAAISTVVTEVCVLIPAFVLLRRELALHVDLAHLAKVAVAAAAGAGTVLLLPGPVVLRLAAGLVVYVAVLLARGGLSRRHLELTRSVPPEPVA